MKCHLYRLQNNAEDNNTGGRRRTIQIILTAEIQNTARIKLSFREWINNKVLLYSTGKHIQCPVIKHNGKEYEKECMYICIHWTAEINTIL